MKGSAKKCTQAFERLLSSTQVVARIGRIIDQILTGDAIQVVLNRIHGPIGVVGANEKHLRHSEHFAVRVGVNHGNQGSATFAFHALGNLQIYVILNLDAVIAPGREVVFYVDGHIQHIDYHRPDGRHALILRPGEPGRPAALGGTRHHKAINGFFQSIIGKILNRVHTPNRTFDHREQQRPGVVAVFLELMEGVGNDLVFLAVAEKRLVGRLPQNGCNRLILNGDFP